MNVSSYRLNGILALASLTLACGSGSSAVEKMGTAGSSGLGTSGSAGMAEPSDGGAPAAAAGASNSGGSGAPAQAGAAPMLPVKVTACPEAVKNVGVWENISPPEFVNPSNMETLAVVVNPVDQAVYAAAGNKTNGGDIGTGVYKSVDCGATWKLVSTGAGSDKIKSGDPWAIMLDATNPDTTLYINNGYGNDPTIYRSTNGGVDFTALSPHPKWGVRSFVQAIAMEKANPKHIAVSFHQDCEAPNTALCLSSSTDSGETWTPFNGPPELTGWQEAATLTILGPTSYLFGAAGGWYTPDSGKTWTKVLKEGFYASYAGSSNVAPDGAVFWAGSDSVYRSTSNPLGAEWASLGNSGRRSVVIDDGVNLFASWAWDTFGKPFYTAKLSDPTVWTQMESPTISRGPNQFAHDPTHHIIYSANWGAGLWRLVSRQ